MKEIVLYNVDEETVEKYKKIHELSEIKFTRCFDEDMEVTIDELFELGDHIGNSNKYQKSFMLMSGIDMDYLTFLNKVLKENNLSFKGVKAMRTKLNKSWKLKRLLDEISEEDEVMSRVTELRKLIISTNDMDLNKFDENISFGLKQALMQGYLLINSKGLKVEKLDEAIQNINYFLEKI